MKKKYKINIIILILVSILIMYFAFKDDFSSTINYLSNANLLWIILAIVFMALNLVFQSLSIFSFLKQVKSDYKFKDAFLLMLYAQFFNAITPFSSGGQPFQMYILKKQGIKVTDSGNILLQNFFTFQLSLIIMGTFSIIINHIFGIIPNGILLKKFVITGYIINIIVLFIIGFAIIAKKLNTELFNKIINFIFKFKFIKDKDKIKDTILQKIDDFYNSAIYFKNNKKILILSSMYNILSLICLYTIPFFIFLSIGEYDSINILQSIVCSGYTFLIGSFVPIPGGTGGLEYGFVQFFQNFTVGATLSACMILWRFITYYLGMILGFVSLLFYKRGEKK